MDPFIQEIARQKHQDLLGAAERHRLARIVRNSKTPHPLPSAANAESKPIPTAETTAVGGQPAR